MPETQPFRSNRGATSAGRAERAAAGHSTVEEAGLVGRVVSVGSGSITIAGGPGLSVKAAVTRATRLTGTVRTLARVHAGDTVDAEITIVDGAARVVSLQDPAIGS